MYIQYCEHTVIDLSYFIMLYHCTLTLLHFQLFEHFGEDSKQRITLRNASASTALPQVLQRIHKGAL